MTIQEVSTMPIFQAFIVMLFSYLLGSVPFGWVVVKVATGRDIRGIESGRTGGTNAMRSAGCLAGLITVVGDGAKALLAVYLARWIFPETSGLRVWMEIAAPLMAIMGHNYSIFLLERHESGRLHIRGGAGGAPAFGGAMGLWLPMALFLFPMIGAIFVLTGYASITTMSIAAIVTVVFAVLAWMGEVPWQYVLYGVIAEIILMWALRPNLARLRAGTERRSSPLKWLKKKPVE
jgi:acyl phosphate:glycerol-3-phosphate acyltransferase